MPEITNLLEFGGNKAYFGGDPMLAPEIGTIAQVGPVDVAFLPTNGLNVGSKPVVMSSEEAAVVAGILRAAAVAIPIHYRFKGGPKMEGGCSLQRNDRAVRAQRPNGRSHDEGNRFRS